jgi:hypothetical protein
MSKTSSLRVPSYCRHKPTDQAVVTINGRDIYLGKWNSTASKNEYGCILESLKVVRELYGRNIANEFGPLALKAVRQRMVDNPFSQFQNPSTRID